MGRGKHVVMVLLLAASFASGTNEAGATQLAPFQTIPATDVVSAGVGGMRGVGSGTITLSGVSGTVRRAYLYWHSTTDSTNPNANASVFVNQTPVTGTNIGFSGNNCRGILNSQAYRADVTGLVAATGNGLYRLTGFGTAPGVNTNGASLIVFFDDGDPSNNRDVALFDGNDSNVANSVDEPNPFDPDGWSATLSGINYTAGPGVIQLHVSDGQNLGASFPDPALILNDVPLAQTGPIFQGDSVPGPGQDSRLWDIKTFDVTSFLSPGLNTLSLSSDGPSPSFMGDCLGLVVAAVIVPAGTVVSTPPVSFPNPAPIQLPTSGVGSAPPSSIDVGGSGFVLAGVTTPAVTGAVRKLTVTLMNVNHSYAADIDVLLVGPGGQSVMLMSDAGANFPLANVTLTFDDRAELMLPALSPIASGTYKPTNLGAIADAPFPAPAPDPPYGSALSVFKGTDPRGEWQLLVRDDLGGDTGSVVGGWRLDIVTGPLVPVRHDLDGDGRTDFAVFSQTSGLWTVQRSLDGSPLQVGFGLPTAMSGDIPVPADYDGDGLTDLAVFRRSTGQFFILPSTTGAVATFTFGPPHPDDIPIPGDYDGDGTTDIALYRFVTGAFFVRRSSNGEVITPCCADPAQSDNPITADYDGDGITDFAVYRAATGEFFIARSSDQVILRFCCASPAAGDVPIPADYDGDHRADLAVYRGSTGEFFIARSSDSALLRFCCADPAKHIPVPGDYDGDGKTDLAVYDLTTGQFFAGLSSDGTILAVPLGKPGQGDVQTINPIPRLLMTPPPPPPPPADPGPQPEPPEPEPVTPTPCKSDPESLAPCS